MLIDPQGLLHGDRVAACSDEAQLHFPRLLAASNTFGRFRLSVDWLHNEVYGSFRSKPTKETITAWLHEYNSNFLLFVYRAPDASMWAQWDVPEKLLGRYRLAADRKTPAPPANELAAFKAAYVESLRVRNKSDLDVISEGFGKVPQACETLRNVSETSAGVQKVLHDVGVVVGVVAGVGVGEVPCSEPSGSKPVANLPTNREGVYFAVTPAMVETWKRLYPAVDVDQQLRNIEGWVISNPKKRKTLGGMPAMITTWMSKEQNAGGNSAAKGNHATSVRNGSNQQNGGARRIDDQLEELRKAGVSVPAGVPEDGAGEVCDPAWGCDGRASPGVVLEGVGG